jgi:hypothetical protein
MRKLVVSIVVACALMLAPTGSAAPVKKYCSPSGDFCQEVSGTKHRPVFLFDTFSLRGEIVVCVRAPSQSWSCKNFPLRERKQGVYTSKVNWHKHFPNEGPGKYRVNWQQDGQRIGKNLNFYR